MRRNGTYQLLEEEVARSRALDFLVENSVAVAMPEEEEAPEEEASDADTGGEEVSGTQASEPEAGEARVEAVVEAGEASSSATNEGKE